MYVYLSDALFRPTLYDYTYYVYTKPNHQNLERICQSSLHAGEITGIMSQSYWWNQAGTWAKTRRVFLVKSMFMTPLLPFTFSMCCVFLAGTRQAVLEWLFSFGFHRHRTPPDGGALGKLYYKQRACPNPWINVMYITCIMVHRDSWVWEMLVYY